MVDDAKREAKLELDEPIEGLGLCLSGCRSASECDRFVREFLSSCPNVTKSCKVANDIVGSIYTSNLNEGGALIIAGTGSNSALFDAQCNVVATCGGWGHLFGDEGSAYWIAWRAYKTLLDHKDCFSVSSHDMQRMQGLVCEHFQIDDITEIEGFYMHHDKRAFASLCKRLYDANQEQRDSAIEHVFEQAGRLLARKVIALLARQQQGRDNNASEAGDSGNDKSTLDIVCVGNVFGGWSLLCDGFERELSARVARFRLLKLTCPSSVGAARFAARHAGVDLPIGSTTERLSAVSV